MLPGHLVQHGEHLRVVQLDALIHLALLDGGSDQAQRPEALAILGAHGRLHIIVDAVFEF
ncbi:hypothetical protein D3C83_333410 [compost metagenome]